MERNYFSIVLKVLLWSVILSFVGLVAYCSYNIKTPSTSWLKDNFAKHEGVIQEAKDLICQAPGKIDITQNSAYFSELSKNQINRLQSILATINAYKIEKSGSCDVSIRVHAVGFAGEGMFIYYSSGNILKSYVLVDKIERPNNPDNIPYHETRFKVHLKNDWYIRYINRS